MMRSNLMAAAAFGLALSLPGAAMAVEATATADVNLRVGPGTGYDVITTIEEGSEIEVRNCLETSDWCDVSWQGRQGWAEASFITLAQNGTQMDVGDARSAGVEVPTPLDPMPLYPMDVGMPEVAPRAE